ncbi:glycoside hydrolase family 3 C-terminal domain-containing protein [Corynebacterium aquatimens]|uniref:glycoside hydrolase family 3 C-terminal domain-containing protein n=1 Tax=Corynebacterium aquatimens TaxID=1190508 RepID=UPI0025411607|nr:glycoside hydrolase family 3 C-terminal domain-containing protein [Corynebacterium aquatimens]QYH19389.1 glycoside hydrolase family 3 C-terminal domain-containing protein [Corynebacterium aquatimens]
MGVGRLATDVVAVPGGATAPYTVPPAEGMRDVLAELGADSPVEVFEVLADASDVSNADAAVAAAVAAAREADTVVLIAGSLEGAEADAQHALISDVLAANPRTLVVLKTTDPSHVPSIGGAHTVIECFAPGQEDGHAVADALFGNVTPPANSLPPTPRSRSATG